MRRDFFLRHKLHAGGAGLILRSNILRINISQISVSRISDRLPNELAEFLAYMFELMRRNAHNQHAVLERDGSQRLDPCAVTIRADAGLHKIVHMLPDRLGPRLALRRRFRSACLWK